MTESFATHAVNVGALISSRTDFECPAFQRRYVWGKANIDAFWDDMIELASEPQTTRFFGSFIFEEQAQATVTAPRRVHVIDGQQRLTTVFIFLLALASEVSDPTYKAELSKTILNDRGELKLKSTEQDRLVLGELATRILREDDSKSSGGRKKSLASGEESPIGKAFRRLQSHIRMRFREFSNSSSYRSVIHEETGRLSSALNRLKVVEVNLLRGSDVDPAQVYDCLNSRGEKLRVADLIKNDLYMALRNGNIDPNEFERNSWQPLVSKFLETDRVGSYDGFLFPYVLVNRSSATRSRLLVHLREMLRDQGPEGLVADQERWAEAFLALRGAHAMGHSLPGAVRSLVHLDPGVAVYPYLMHALRAFWDDLLDEAGLEAIFAWVEAFLVRRGFVGLEPTGLHVVFKDLWDNSGADVSKALKRLRSLSTVRVPSDEEFREAVLHAPLYRRKSILRHVIWSYEESLPGDRVDEVFEVDHLIAHGSELGRRLVGERGRDAIDVWANLVPLSVSVNRSKGAQAGEAISRKILAESQFRTPRSVALKWPEFDIDDLDARANELAEWALDRWRLP